MVSKRNAKAATATPEVTEVKVEEVAATGAETIAQKLSRYNKLAAEARALGLKVKDRSGFKDQSTADKSLAALESSIRAGQQSSRAVAREESGDASAEDAKTEESNVAAKSKSKSKAKTKTAKARTTANGEAKISSVKANPFKEGTSRYKQLEKARKAGTRAEFIKAGGDGAYLSWFARNGLAKVG